MSDKTQGPGQPMKVGDTVRVVADQDNIVSRIWGGRTGRIAQFRTPEPGATHPRNIEVLLDPRPNQPKAVMFATADLDTIDAARADSEKSA